MITKEDIIKYASGLTVEDVLDSEEFVKAYKDVYNRLSAQILAVGEPEKLKSNPLLVLWKSCALIRSSAFKEQYLKVLGKVSKLPSGQRAAIKQLGDECYNIALIRMIEKRKEHEKAEKDS